MRVTEVLNFISPVRGSSRAWGSCQGTPGRCLADTHVRGTSPSLGFLETTSGSRAPGSVAEGPERSFRADDVRACGERRRRRRRQGTKRDSGRVRPLLAPWAAIKTPSCPAPRENLAGKDCGAASLEQRLGGRTFNSIAPPLVHCLSRELNGCCIGASLEPSPLRCYILPERILLPVYLLELRVVG